ncbi:protein phosphatase 2C family protein [Actinidia rufa]|uniref:Protein phosphatase 2C family protein n=1 Tax=Actinidia rufa TaxID=165716 RepID=A0A7J0H1L8_9ERIC|nr:protein phosphatase 2C family protein [Actinidia rufa]
MFNGLAKSFLIKKGRNSGNCDGREAVEALAKEAKKNELILRSSGTVNVDGSNNFASVFSKRGEKGVNQDCFIVWEEFGCQEDMMFCGIFDGHGSWGHYVAKRVRETLPLSLCAAVDQDLAQHCKIDSFYSGTTALTVVRQGELIFVANVGDSRAVLATTSDDGSLVPVQLTTDFKPNLPQEAERIFQCKGRVFCLDDESGVHRLWLPAEESPGLAMSRAFGDYCVKDFGLISVPEVTQRHITAKDQFVVLATDGVWDVISPMKRQYKSYLRRQKGKNPLNVLVNHAVRAWKHKRRGIATDDISAICLFFHSSPSSQQIHPVSKLKQYL